jgi:hypothetical protein
MQMDDFDYQEPDWTSPESLRLCAARLKAQMAKQAIAMDRFRRFAPTPVPHNPFADIAPDDPAVAEERAIAYRTARAKEEILAALAAEKQQAQQQRSDAQQQFRQTAIGRLFR